MKKVIRLFRWVITCIFGTIALIFAFITATLELAVLIGNSSHPSGMGPSVGGGEHLLSVCCVGCSGGAMFLLCFFVAKAFMPTALPTSDPTT